MHVYHTMKVLGVIFHALIRFDTEIRLLPFVLIQFRIHFCGICAMFEWEWYWLVCQAGSFHLWTTQRSETPALSEMAFQKACGA